MTMTVYVPLDGSTRAERALGPAAALASRADGAVVVFAAPWPDTSAETVHEYLAVQAAFLDVPARPWLLLDRDPADAVRLAATEPDAMVCMTTRGRGLIREALLGGVAEEIIRTSVAPVLFVGPRFDTGWELSDSPLVLAGIDGSTPSLAAARAAGDLAAAIGGRVRVIEVLRPSDVVAVGDFPGGDVAMLEAAVADLSARGVAADYEIVDGFDAADTLADRATAGQPTVIAVASHGRTGLARAVLGSVAMRTLRHARCPVLVTGPGVHRHAADGAAVNSTHDAAPT